MMPPTRQVIAEWPAPTRSDLERFFAKVRVEANGCWVWTATTTPAGYGRFKYHGRLQLAHAFATWLVGRPCPVGLEHDHLCLRKPCVNPAHLRQVTTAENKRRERHSRPTCARGHRWTPKNTRWASKGDGSAPYRHCRACRADLARRRRAMGKT